MSVPLKQWLATVPWLQGLPSGWRVKRFKATAMLSVKDNSVERGDQLLSLSTSRGIVPKEYDDENQIRSGEDLKRYWLVRPGHVVVNPMWLAHGSIAAAHIEGVISPDYRVYQASGDVDPCYLALLLQTIEYRGLYELFVRGSTTYDRRVSKDDFHSLPVVVPPLTQQRAIAQSVARSTTAIDALISKKERLTRLLQEKRRALITQAVTKGLDPKVPMKDSGIEWLGRVPQHWAILPVRRLFRCLDGRRVPVEAVERSQRQGDYPYYGASGIIDYIDNFIFDEPLVLVCEDGWNLLLRSQPVARALYGKAWVNNHAHVLRPHRGDVAYWAAALEQTPFDFFVTGMRQPKLTADALREIPLPVPPEDEGRAIAAYVRKCDSDMDALLARLENSMEVLREYRQALIAEVVIGKLPVSTEAA